MGLIKEGDRFAVLSDILGDEDHLGDMDFKVAGTRDGVTALQMDIKITGITEEIMRTALEQARDGRFHILDNMDRALSSAREGISEHAPRITAFSIPRDKIREVIGTGGKVIREICEVTGAKIDIEDDGTIKVAAVDSGAADKAIEWIRGIVAEPEVGVIYSGKVVKVVDFGAFVNFLGARDGLVHISELAPRRVGKGDRRGQRGRRGEGQGAGHRRPGQGAPVDEGRRPGDRGGHFRQARGSEGGGARRRLSPPPGAADARNAPGRALRPGGFRWPSGIRFIYRLKSVVAPSFRRDAGIEPARPGLEETGAERP